MNFLKNKLHLLPNILSILRIILTIVVLVLLFIDSNNVIYSFSINDIKTEVSSTFLASGIIFVVACITDFLDGFLARKYNWISDFGKIWDAISDKILTTSVYISFAVLNLIPIYFVLIMVFRDFIIDGYRMFSSKHGIIVPANFFGKSKAVLQMISLILIFFVFNESINTHNVYYYLVQNLFVILATISSVISGVIYVVSIEKKIKEIKKQNSSVQER
ncbi:CDP-diacylglycerol--glycerol-3-phosphate 3-phosphatidyltransferase [Malacoplasma penetrans]|uniref:CDP-diacylglycerol--glycerol-3-phosphate 3-phosphatidyltransferase n=1 Tax=Malacoplasma penetrans (strain HF-2) TaxID=272633 RepID=Q8EW02_MALP2|nr:CDP-diacylglycerol--glycerol-3-phosphate 3-phosphatidyltransferase [Malacoplasma penetrans]RXY97201.1 CDP-diacylglycerol--glycerol-3-phosphate 3-phosphatidyltransferase [Malacoplasma penetrans]BAC44195.1 phosphatidylglycerophosphate synthase [Malacoplasma penetrans HF-2]